MKNLLAEANVATLKAWKIEQVNNKKISNSDKEKRVALIDAFIKRTK